MISKEIMRAWETHTPGHIVEAVWRVGNAQVHCIMSCHLWQGIGHSPLALTVDAPITRPYIESGLVHYEWFLKYPLDKKRSKSGVPQVWAYDVCLKVTHPSEGSRVYAIEVLSPARPAFVALRLNPINTKTLTTLCISVQLEPSRHGALGPS